GEHPGDRHAALLALSVPVRDHLGGAAGCDDRRGGDRQGPPARRRRGPGARMIPLSWLLLTSALLFVIGVVGVLVRRNALIIFMSVELMLNAGNLAFVAFARQL